jgi:hypothetical protein
LYAETTKKYVTPFTSPVGWYVVTDGGSVAMGSPYKPDRVEL